ncbi:MAG: histidinol dehydrogenase [Acidobacteria bacterium]|nr:histidinol dehydrogenase [Acidobacteriota bacterium]
MKLRRIRPEDVRHLDRQPVSRERLEAAAEIVEAIRSEGVAAARRYAEQFGEIREGGAMVVDRTQLVAALEGIPRADRDLLERTADRIETFARAQREALSEATIEIPGGHVGHRIAPVGRAGCYAPGGRYPLPSSVLMTAVTARVAGVKSVVVASPRPLPVTLAAAAVAGAHEVLTLGGAHAIAVLAVGIDGFEPCDLVVGPGNTWVTAAKQLVFGTVGIDMLAGPSELVILADDNADAATVAADLLAQAEHDPDALPVLVSTSEELVASVDAEIECQLETLPTRAIAEQAMVNGFAVVVPDLETAASICGRLAPEHLQVMTERPEDVASQLDCWGGLFIGDGSAEVLGDYGAGPNHTLPTGGVARYRGGLSVFDFLRVRTWMEIDNLSEAGETVEDSIALARLEGLEAHARAAELRLKERIRASSRSNV